MKRICNYMVVGLYLFSFSITIGKVYKGAEYRTNETFLYGRFEVRYKPANREGVVSSFFTYHEFDNSTGWNEIDFEFIGRYKNLVQFNTITPGQRFHIRSQQLNYNPYLDFHNYAFEWTPNYVAWFVDGVEVFRQTGNHISTLEYPQKIMMNIWNPIYTDWAGYFDADFLPTSSVYDFVEYSAYTPGSGNNGTENNFTFQWKDDFDNYDSERWSMASHTFGGNLADFDQENIVFKDGNLYLYLTNDIEKAGVDNIPPKIIWAMGNYDSTISIKFSEEISIVSGENTGNYILPGVLVENAILSEDKLYATLITENFNPYNLNNLIYSGFTDLSSNSNTSDTKVITIANVDSIIFPIKVNVGGNVFSDYMADQEWNPSLSHGYLMGQSYKYPSSLEILNTEQDELFRSERRGIISYKFKVPNGNYSVSLMFSDNTNTGIGDGVFNVFSEGEYIQENLDLISLVGKNISYKFDTEIEVKDGILDIYFEEEIDSAFISAIVVDRIITDVNNRSTESFRSDFELNQNYPNPFNPSTKISFSLRITSDISLDIYDVIGNELQTLMEGRYSAGNYVVEFDTAHLSSGIYFYRLSTNRNNILTKKMLLLK